jgi:hypothetical protein
VEKIAIALALLAGPHTHMTPELAERAATVAAAEYVPVSRVHCRMLRRERARCVLGGRFLSDGVILSVRWTVKLGLRRGRVVVL